MEEREMTYEEVFECLTRKDPSILKDKKTFRKAMQLDKVIDLVLRRVVSTESRLLKRSPAEDDKRWLELYELEKKKKTVAKLFDTVEKMVKQRFS